VGRNGARVQLGACSRLRGRLLSTERAWRRRGRSRRRRVPATYSDVSLSRRLGLQEPLPRVREPDRRRLRLSRSRSRCRSFVPLAPGRHVQGSVLPSDRPRALQRLSGPLSASMRRRQGLRPRGLHVCRGTLPGLRTDERLRYGGGLPHRLGVLRPLRLSRRRRGNRVRATVRCIRLPGVWTRSGAVDTILLAGRSLDASPTCGPA